ncbi:pyridoxamine 5'-phosphate oxidase family protein [Heyndrickxia faecalis]|uniref:pyridoxamine 5'-phosphate oxidase family protein n=1 Tax=Heyndrickxia faecalis TaxID=2824910 RepID=UPI003D1F0991
MMSEVLSEELFELLNGRDLSKKQHAAMMLLTVSEDMWPHTAMVSAGEVLALSETELRFAIWPHTETTNNMKRTQKAMLVVVYKGKVNYMKLTLEELPDLLRPKYERARFAAKIESVRTDIAKYADITSGVTIQLKDPEAALERWKGTLEELKK